MKSIAINNFCNAILFCSFQSNLILHHFIMEHIIFSADPFLHILVDILIKLFASSTLIIDTKAPS